MARGEDVWLLGILKTAREALWLKREPSDRPRKSSDYTYMWKSGLRGYVGKRWRIFSWLLLGEENRWGVWAFVVASEHERV